jgi:hypothetical protein
MLRGCCSTICCSKSKVCNRDQLSKAPPLLYAASANHCVGLIVELCCQSGAATRPGDFLQFRLRFARWTIEAVSRVSTPTSESSHVSMKARSFWFYIGTHHQPGFYQVTLKVRKALRVFCLLTVHEWHPPGSFQSKEKA